RLSSPTLTILPLKRLFFFSSRRRHTRFSRDWSSDVCSSDLAQQLADDGAVAVRAHPQVGTGDAVRVHAGVLQEDAAAGYVDGVVAGHVEAAGAVQPEPVADPFQEGGRLVGEAGGTKQQPGEGHARRW